VTDVSREMFRSFRVREPAGHHHHAEGPLASHAG
jgi:hypothetical protein